MEPSFHIAASDYVDALRRNGVDHFVTVPDYWQMSVHKRVEEGVPGLKVVRCCTEEQAVNVSVGLRVGGKRPVVVIQNQGFYACVNAVRAAGLDARMPIVFIVGQFGREFANFGEEPSKSGRNTVRLLEPVMDALGVRHWRLETENDLPRIDEAIAYAERESCPVALIVGAPTAWQ